MRGTVRAAHYITDPDGSKRAAPGSSWWWQCTLSSRDSDGKPVRQQIRRRGYPSKKAASAALSEFLVSVGRGDVRRAVAQPSAQPLQQYLADWIEARGPSLKPSSRHIYGVVIRAWIVPLIGGQRPLRSITGRDITKWTSTLREHGGRGGKPLGSRSVELANMVMGSAMRDAVESGMLAVSPMDEVPRRQRPRHRPTQHPNKVWNSTEAAQFLATVRDHREFAMWATFLDSGARRGEIVALRWEDVTDDTITIRRNRVIVDRDVIEGSVKNDKPRTVELDRRTMAALRAWRKTQLTERLAAGPAYVDSGFVFTDEVGEPLKPASVSHRFDRTVKQLDLPQISLHGTRHSCTSILLAAGVPVNVVAARIGDTAEVVLRTYAHVIRGSDRGAAALLGAALYGTTGGANLT